MKSLLDIFSLLLDKLNNFISKTAKKFPATKWQMKNDWPKYKD